MQRRELSVSLLMAAATGAAIPLEQARAQTCSQPCYPQTAAESTAASAYAAAHQADPTNPPYPTLNTTFPPGNVKRYGATGTGQSDDWLAIQAAIDGCSSFVYSRRGPI